MIKILGVLGVGRAYLNTVKAVYENFPANAMFNSEETGAFSLRSGSRQGRPLSSLLFHAVLGIQARGIR